MLARHSRPALGPGTSSHASRGFYGWAGRRRRLADDGGTSLAMSGVLLVALLGFAWGRMESWWLLLADSAWYLVGSATYLVPALLGMDNVLPPDVSLTARAALAIAHVGIIVAAVLGYRSWKRGVSTTPQPVPLQGNL